MAANLSYNPKALACGKPGTGLKNKLSLVEVEDWMKVGGILAYIDSKINFLWLKLKIDWRLVAY